MITSTNTEGMIQVVVSSFGYLHGNPPPADITFDVRQQFRDPLVDPALRELTGFDEQIMDRVLGQPGAFEFIDAIAQAVVFMRSKRARERRIVRVAIGCSGGRHRSVALAIALGVRLNQGGVGVKVEHRDVELAVVTT